MIVWKCKRLYSSCLDLSDGPLEEVDWDLFTEGSSFVNNTDEWDVQQVIEAAALPPAPLPRKQN